MRPMVGCLRAAHRTAVTLSPCEWRGCLAGSGAAPCDRGALQRCSATARRRTARVRAAYAARQAWAQYACSICASGASGLPECYASIQTPSRLRPAISSALTTYHLFAPYEEAPQLERFSLQS